MNKIKELEKLISKYIAKQSCCTTQEEWIYWQNSIESAQHYLDDLLYLDLLQRQNKLMENKPCN